MARRELVRRLNLELAPDERPGYVPKRVNTLVDWICEADSFDEQDERTQLALDRLRAGDDD